MILQFTSLQSIFCRRRRQKSSTFPHGNLPTCIEFGRIQGNQEPVRSPHPDSTWWSLYHGDPLDFSLFFPRQRCWRSIKLEVYEFPQKIELPLIDCVSINFGMNGLILSHVLSNFSVYYLCFSMCYLSFSNTHNVRNFKLQNGHTRSLHTALHFQLLSQWCGH